VSFVAKKVFMNCMICRQAEFINSFTSIPFERDEFKLVINNIPAQVCPSCGESIVDELVAIRLLSITEDIISEGLFEVICDYDKCV